MKSRLSKVAILFLVAALLMPLTSGAGFEAVSAKGISPSNVHFYLTILHNNDGESQVVNAGAGLEDFGGAARFKTVVDNLKWEAIHGPWTQRGAKRGVVMLSSGDNYLAGPEFNASLENGVPFYDTIAMELIGYDAVNLGNHDFDFGPDVLADFIDGYTLPPPYVSANLDFSGEWRLQAYVDAGVIVPAAIIMTRGERVGVIGLETPNLPFISSPRNVEVSDDLVNIVQGEIDKLTAAGVNKIILTSHLQSIQNEIDLAGQLKGLDVIIAGGGDELLANPDDLLLPVDEGLVYGEYPLIAYDMVGNMVPVVTTSGEYRYVGQLVVGFDKSGNLVTVEQNRSGPVRVATDDCNGYLPCDDAVVPDATMQAMVVDPVLAYVENLASNVIGFSEVDLDGLRTTVRAMESNEGNLIADSLFWHADQVADIYGVNHPDVALQNGGGIRNNTIIPAGDITELDTFDMVPFANFVSIVEDIPRAQFKEILENAVSRVEAGDGRFAQISGFSFSWDPAGIPQVLDADGNVVTPGTRVVDVRLDDGTIIVSGGSVVAGDPLNVATIDFLARGGDLYPFRGAPFTTLGATYQLALSNYIQDGLAGLISAADYPFGGEGRITTVSTVASMLAVGSIFTGQTVLMP
jgi:2',3'-cyclic-nucleotide 2'-phosphodiesterase (5'-nucleotidase family)